MEILYSKILVIFLVFLGETLAIYAEMIGARTHFITSQPFLQIFLKMLVIIVIAGGFLIAGYMLGLKAFQNIWIVSVTSITSILIMEPILAYTVFQQLPTKGAIIGLILGVLGFISTILL
jgi:hypothetical protein